MKVLMVGATGTFAHLVLPALKARGATVRALVRDDDKASEAKGRGADETAVGDLRDAASLRAAAEGVDGVFHIDPVFQPDESEMGVRMVEAARDAGVGKFVFSSVIHPSIDKMANHRNKRPVEEALYESGMTFVVLQPAMFMQTLAESWPAVSKTGMFGLPYSRDAKCAYVDYRDVAEVAAVGMTDDLLDHGTLELCAGGMVDRVEMAAMMSDVLGKPVEATEPAFDEWAEKAGLPDDGPRREGMAKMYAVYDRYGFPGGNPLVLRTILGREPRTLRAFLGELEEGA